MQGESGSLRHARCSSLLQQATGDDRIHGVVIIGEGKAGLGKLAGGDEAAREALLP